MIFCCKCQIFFVLLVKRITSTIVRNILDWVSHLAINIIYGRTNYCRPYFSTPGHNIDIFALNKVKNDPICPIKISTMEVSHIEVSPMEVNSIKLIPLRNLVPPRSVQFNVGPVKISPF